LHQYLPFLSPAIESNFCYLGKKKRRIPKLFSKKFKAPIY